MHNYNGVLQICAAFVNASVYRLKKTWEKIAKQVSCDSCLCVTSHLMHLVSVWVQSICIGPSVKRKYILDHLKNNDSLVLIMMNCGDVIAWTSFWKRGIVMSLRGGALCSPSRWLTGCRRWYRQRADSRTCATLYTGARARSFVRMRMRNNRFVYLKKTLSWIILLMVCRLVYNAFNLYTIET